MTSRERIIAALNHQEPDRVPVDLGGAVVTGIHVSALDKLRKALHLDPHPVKVYDEQGKTEIPQRPGGHFAELYARFTNLDDPSDVGLGLLEIVFSQEYQGIKAV